MNRQGYVLLDRDGTIIADKHYLSDPGRVELLEHAASGLKKLCDAGLGLIVISNQSGIGRGLFTARDLARVERRLVAILEAEGVRIDGFYYCPHLPEADCDCRKPRPALANRAAATFGFDPQTCWVIGDKPADVELATAIGARSILVRTGYGAQHEADGLTANHISDNLLEAAESLLTESNLTPIELTPASAGRLRAHISAGIETRQRLLAECEHEILAISEMVAGALGSGRKLLLCGNGGSASDCQHIAAELVSVLTQQFLRPGLPAIALSTNSAILTASANDFGFEGVFARQVQAFGKPGDVLIGMSTSGKSMNVIRALEYARAHGIKTVGFACAGARDMAALCDVCLRVPSAVTALIQEVHITVGHIVCDLAEQALLAAGVFELA